MAMGEDAFDIVGIGIPYTDVLVRVSHLPAADEALRVLERDVQGGGKVPTACAAAAHLGVRVAVMGQVGGGPLAAGLAAELAAGGVDVAGLRSQPDRRGPLSVILIEAGTGARSILWDPGDLADHTLTDADRARIAAARCLLVSEPFPAAREAAAWARAHGVTVVWDADVPDPAWPGLAASVDHCVASAAFAATLGGPELALHRLPGSVAIVTLGGDGLIGRTPAGPFRLPAFAVEVVDTTGAGDVFHGAYAAALLRGLEPAAAARYASAAAALKCRSLGGRRGLPSHAAVRALLDRPD